MPKRRKSLKRVHHKFTEKAFARYVRGIGQFDLAWNDLHEKLGALFCKIMGDRQKAVLIWNSATFDKPRRNMLLAAVKGASEPELLIHPRLIKDITWICERTEEVEHARNDAIHSPLLQLGTSPMEQILFGSLAGTVFPNTHLDNQRALSLAKKDLLQEFRLGRDTSNLLRDFADAIELILWVEGSTWPHRPQLPNWPGRNRSRAPQ